MRNDMADINSKFKAKEDQIHALVKELEEAHKEIARLKNQIEEWSQAHRQRMME